MQVNIFISRKDGRSPDALLVLPFGPQADIPPDLRHLCWQHFLTTLTDDKLLGAKPGAIEADLAESGFALVQPVA